MKQTRKMADFNILTSWIDNQKSFETHKKSLDKIYMKSDKKSMREFGLEKNETFQYMKNKIKNSREIQKFHDNEKKAEMSKKDQILYGRINEINKRKNNLLKNEEMFNTQRKYLKGRIEILKGIKTNELQKENEKITMRIIQKKPSLNLKKYSDEYNMKKTYMNYSKKFELPKLSNIGPKVMKRKIDLSPYNRALRMNSNSPDRSVQQDSVLVSC